MAVDYIMNGECFGGTAQQLLKHGMRPEALRPWVSRKNGGSYLDVWNAQTGKMEARPIMNAEALLFKDEWQWMDRTVIEGARPRMKIFNQIRAAGLVLNVPNAMGHPVIQYQTMGHISGATLSMDGRRRSEADRFTTDLQNFPLPLVHKDCEFSIREIATARNNGRSLDGTMIRKAGEVCGEEIEKLTIGLLNTYSYGGGTIYGLTNLVGRLTQTLTAPTTGGWTGDTIINELLSMRQKLQDDRHWGPYRVYYGNAWDAYLDKNYVSGYPQTLRTRITEIPSFATLENSDYLTGFQIVMVQMTEDVIRAVMGFDLITIQAKSDMDMELKFKVVGCMAPQLRGDADGQQGICHGNT